MPEDLAAVIVQVLKIVNIVLNTWVEPGASEPLTNQGLSLVDAIATVSVTLADFAARLLMNNPI